MDTPQNQTGMDRLRKAIIAQKTASLSEPPDDPGLQALYSALLEYDQFVSQMVIGVLSGANSALPYPNREQVDRAVDDATSQPATAYQRKVEQYRNYKNRLDEMHDLAIEAAASNQS